MTTLHLPAKALRPGAPADGAPTWDLYLDDRLVASGYLSERAAQLELDLIAWSATFGSAPLAPDRPVADEALGLALSVFNRLFSTLKLQEKARVALDQIIRPGIYTITADGDLSVLASSSRGRAGAKPAYTITAQPAPRADARAADEAPAYAVSMACECRDFWARGCEHGGVCKHIAARLLLFLAQQGVGFLKHLRDALDTRQPNLLAINDAPATGAGAMAFLDIDAPDLLAALFLVAQAAAPITLCIAAGALNLSAGAVALTLPGLDGGDAAGVRLAAEAGQALYDQLRAAARSAGVITIFVDPSDGAVALSGSAGGFSALAAGSPAPIARTATAPAANPVVAALHELFALLETHEPDWYARWRDRVADDAAPLRQIAEKRIPWTHC